ncbi:MAG TPA: stage V sporulation protein AD [Lachnospiraceae bacterium]|nr:stage V sporulation protein AD [Lachnospiraceae bacterium]
MSKKMGNQTIRFANPPIIVSAAAIVGKKEGEGPLADFFDKVVDDPNWGEDSWEKAESKFVRETMALAINKASIKTKDIDYVFSGDLLNQCCGSTFGIKDFKIPFFGLFGACSTMGESMSLGAMAVDGGFATNVLCGAGSHFCSAEKQFRFPLGMGTQRPPSATWTVTGNGAVVIGNQGTGAKITHITTGKIMDMGIKDAGNMGAAMAPAACQVIAAHFQDTGRHPDYYDVIATGDLGYIGRTILRKLLKDEGYILNENLTDCGIEIFDRDKQDTHSGGSGCGCAAATFCGYYNTLINYGKIKKLLLVPTGALMSTTSSQQGESIPAIAHAVAIEME